MKLLLLIAPLLACLRAGSVSSSFFLSMIINCNANYIFESGHSIKIVQQAFYALLLLLITFGKMLPPYSRQKLVLKKFSSLQTIELLCVMTI